MTDTAAKAVINGAVFIFFSLSGPPTLANPAFSR